MITKKMKEYIEDWKSGEKKKTVKHCVYIHRINKRIARELDMLLWLCVYHPEVFLGETSNEETKKNLKVHLRLRKLLQCVKAVNPQCQVQYVLNALRFEGLSNAEIEQIKIREAKERLRNAEGNKML